MDKANDTAQQIKSQVDGQLDKQRQEGSFRQHPNFGRLLKPGSSEVLMKIHENLHDGKARVGDLMRAVKHDSDSPPALLAKYIVYRVNNLEKYGTYKDNTYDDHFLKNHRAHSNDHVEASDLHQWLSKNPQLISGMIKHQDMLHNWIRRGVGLNVKKNEGKEYVALTRGLSDSYQEDKHSLAPFSDQQDSGFGNVQHSIWVPLDDVWFAYPAAPEWIRGPLGHQNEFLVSNSGRRFKGRPTDVYSSRFGEVPPEYLSVDGKSKKGSTEELMEPIFDDALHNHLIQNPWAKEYFAKHPDRIKTEAMFSAAKGHGMLDSKFVSREEAKSSILTIGDKVEGVEALGNPNLTPQDLIELIDKNNVLDGNALDHIVSNPQYNEHVATSLVIKAAKGDSLDEVVAKVLSNKHAPEKVGRMLVDGLLNGKEWASEAVFGIEGNGMNPQMGDNVINAVLRARTELPGLWNGVDIAPLFAHLPLTDLTFKHLVDAEKKTIPEGQIVFYDGSEGEMEQDVASKCLYMAGRYNQFVDPRSAALLSQSPSALQGMVEREEWLPRTAQEVIVSQAPNESWAGLAKRRDLLPDVIKSMLEKIRQNEPTKNEFSEQEKYIAFVKSIIGELSNNPNIHWQELWGSVKNKNSAAPKIISHISSKNKWSEPFDYSEGIFEGELLNGILRKRLNERNLEEEMLSEFPEVRRD